VWFHSCMRLNISGNSPPTVKRKDLCQSEQAQACFCGAPPRSGTVCGTVRSSPALERTAFLWKYKKIVYEFLSHMNANSVLNDSFPCKQDSAYE